jgi:hypothetical protein
LNKIDSALANTSVQLFDLQKSHLLQAGRLRQQAQYPSGAVMEKFVYSEISLVRQGYCACL